MLEQKLTDPARDSSADAPSTAAVLLSAPPAVRRLTGLAIFIALLAVCFSQPLFQLVRFALASSLYSHILLIPFISAYLIWLRRSELVSDSPPCRRAAILPLLIGVALGATAIFASRSGWKPAQQDFLALIILSFLLFVFAACLFFLSASALKSSLFAMAFLFFALPLPQFLERNLESLLQRGSAETACLMLTLSGMPVFQQGTSLRLPGFAMEVAPQCSGIHSSLVLVITALLAGHLLLTRSLNRVLLVVAVIPLALLRNGFRIFTLGQLCVRVNPDWINSDLHHRGGPIFFAISLVPFFLLLLFLRKREFRAN